MTKPRPRKVIDSIQTWFWVSARQTREAEAGADLVAGRVERFESDDELLAAFRDRMKQLIDAVA